MYISIWMAVVGEVLPCEREVNNYHTNIIFVFGTDARIRKFLEDEIF